MTTKSNPTPASVINRRTALVAMAAISTAAGSGAAIASPCAGEVPAAAQSAAESVLALIERHRAAIAAHERTCDYTTELYNRFPMKPPAVQVGWRRRLQDDSREPIFRHCEEDIVKWFNPWTEAGFPTDRERAAYSAKRDEKIAELRGKRAVYELHKRDVGIEAAELEEEATWQAKADALEALIACRPTTLAEASAKAGYLVDVVDFDCSDQARRALQSIIV